MKISVPFAIISLVGLVSGASLVPKQEKDIIERVPGTAARGGDTPDGEFADHCPPFFFPCASGGCCLVNTICYGTRYCLRLNTMTGGPIRTLSPPGAN